MAKQPKPHLRRTIKLTVVFYVLAVAGTLTVINACKKGSPSKPSAVPAATEIMSSHQTETAIVTIANIRQSPEDASINQVMFYERQEIFSIPDAATLAILQKAYSSGQRVKVTTDPWAGTIKQVTIPTPQEVRANHTASTTLPLTAPMHSINAASLDASIDNAQSINMPAPLPGLTNVIPDLATAQIMFTYFAQQSCNLPGPPGIDQCISFQYVEDGCYARAHKMSWIIMNKYHYSVKKLFSYGNLSVRANKWGGCCVAWWYHVAPLVIINTPQGPKSYVMDPGMFDGPVPMSTWLGAQHNTGCFAGAAVTSYSIQPVTAYWPNGSSGYDTDPDYSMTNGTLVSYSSLKTCP